MAVTRAYGDALRAALGSTRVKVYLRNRTIRWIATLVTLHYVGFCFLFFSLSLQQVRTLFRTLPVELLRSRCRTLGPDWRAVDAVAVCDGACAGRTVEGRAIGSALAGWPRASDAPAAHVLDSVHADGVVVLVLYVEWAFQQEPPPVLYMAF